MSSIPSMPPPSSPIERLVAAYGDAQAVALVREVVEQRVVLSRAIVPEGDRIRAPLEAAHELGHLDVAVEHLQHGRALVRLELDDPGGEAAIDVERLLACYRVGADDANATGVPVVACNPARIASSTRCGRDRPLLACASMASWTSKLASA